MEYSEMKKKLTKRQFPRVIYGAVNCVKCGEQVLGIIGYKERHPVGVVCEECEGE